MSLLAPITLLMILPGVSALHGQEARRRLLLPGEENSYGPVPYNELIADFVLETVNALLANQREDGSWSSQQAVGNSIRIEAGGSMSDPVTTARACRALSVFKEIDPKRIQSAINRGARYVANTHGRVKENPGYSYQKKEGGAGNEMPWRYIYSLHSMVDVHPHVTDPVIQRKVHAACATLAKVLYLQQHRHDKASDFTWTRSVPLDIAVENNGEGAAEIITSKVEGLKKGDVILKVNGVGVGDCHDYSIQELAFHAGDTVTFEVAGPGRHEGGSVVRVVVPRASSGKPGTLGIVCEYGNKTGVKGYIDPVPGAVIESLEEGGVLDLPAGTRIMKVNNTHVGSRWHLEMIERSLSEGQEVEVAYTNREGSDKVSTKKVTLPASKRDPHREIGLNVWNSKNPGFDGGWAYYNWLQGPVSFVTSDALYSLAKAKAELGLDIDEKRMILAYTAIGRTRVKRQDCRFETYKYDFRAMYDRKTAAGDAGRTAAVEMACVYYSDKGFETPGGKRTHDQLEGALRVYMEHGKQLSRVSAGHNRRVYNIACWFWQYGHYTTAEAVSYWRGNEAFKREVRRKLLKSYFAHFRKSPVPLPGHPEIDRNKTRWYANTCNSGTKKTRNWLVYTMGLFGMGALKDMYELNLDLNDPALGGVIQDFKAMKYGHAWVKLKKAGGDPGQKRLLRERIRERFDGRLADIREIAGEYPGDALDYLEEMKVEFAGYEEEKKVEELIRKLKG